MVMGHCCPRQCGDHRFTRRFDAEHTIMSRRRSMPDAIAELVPDGASVAIGLQMEQMIPFAAEHEIIRQRKRGLTLIGPISDILFDQMIGAGCVEQVIAAWVGNVMMGSAYNFRRAVEQDELKVFNMTNFTVALALQAGAMGVPFLPTKTALGSDVSRGNEFFAEIDSPFSSEFKSGSRASLDLDPSTALRGGPRGRPSPHEQMKVHPRRALHPDVTIEHAQRADRDGNP